MAVRCGFPSVYGRGNIKACFRGSNDGSVLVRALRAIEVLANRIDLLCE